MKQNGQDTKIASHFLLILFSCKTDPQIALHAIIWQKQINYTPRPEVNKIELLKMSWSRFEL